MVKVNFAAAKSEFPVLAEDVVEAKLIKATMFKTASGPNKGSDNVKLEFQRDEGEDVENPNMHFFQNYSLLPQSVWKLRQHLEALDCDPEILNDEDYEVEDAVKTVMQNRCALELDIEEYESNERGPDGKPITKSRNVIKNIMRV